MTDALALGEKVLYQAAGPEKLLAELGETGRDAQAAGRLEIADAHRWRAETGGQPRALRELHEDLVRRALGSGYHGVALTTDEDAARIMLPEPADRMAHEHDLQRLAALPGVRVLCCCDTDTEQADLLEALVGVHHGCVDDVLWSTRCSADRLLVRGEIDVANAGRFGAALRAAAAHGIRTVDLGGVNLLSAAAMRAFDDAAGLLRDQGDRLRLVNMSPGIHRTVTALNITGDRRLEVVAPDQAVAPPPSAPDRAHVAVLARELLGLTGLLIEVPSLATVLTRITDLARQVVPGAAVVSVTLRAPDGGFHTPISTDGVAEELDKLQYALDEGPCLDVARLSSPAIAVSGDLASEPIWPRFGPGAAALGMRSVLATALVPDAEPPRLSGVLNLYSPCAEAFTTADRDMALILAGYASLALATTEAITLQDLESNQLHKAIDSRDVIGQAKGILMQHRGISAEEAFAMLRERSQHLNVRVVELARTLVARHTGIDVPADQG